jgi:hypothetical protein
MTPRSSNFCIGFRILNGIGQDQDWLFSWLGLHGVSAGVVNMPRFENVDN